jgi:hypothetical protein
MAAPTGDQGMNVEHILRSKGRTVVSIESNRTLGEAARLLSERKIGAILVGDAFRPVLGILSERDIVRAVAARGAAALDEPVSSVMTEKVVTCTGGSAIQEVMEMMQQIAALEHGPRFADHLLQVGERPLCGLPAKFDAFGRAVEFEQAHLGELRRHHHVGRIAGEA